MKFEAVEATLEEAHHLGYINALSWQAAYRGLVPEQYLEGFTVEKRTNRFRDGIQKNEARYFVFFVDGEAAGMAVLDRARDDDADEHTGEICALYFLPQWWGSGCAKQAMQFCLSYLKKEGYRKAILWVFAGNPRARRFYEKNGFLLDGATQEVDFGKPLEAVRYTREIMPHKS